MLNKIETLKFQSNQKEALCIMHEFRNALLKHFEVVDANTNRLLESR